MPSIHDHVQESLVDTDFKAIDSNTQMSDLDIICTHCTVYDSKANLKVKKFLKYDARNERFVCEQCHRVVSEQKIRSVLKLNQEEYIHYEKATPVEKTLRKRADVENYVIVPVNPVPLGDPSRAPRVIAINRADGNTSIRDDSRKVKPIG